MILMPKTNFERMILLAEKSFDAKNDPEQLDVTEEVISRLLKIHPSTVSEFDDGHGPVAWLIVIPTTYDLMERFLEKEISEKALFDLTPTDASYDVLYLSSALVLEEYRRKGITKQLALSAIENIRRDHPMKAIFVWPFSKEGNLMSETIARLAGLSLYKRPS